MLSTRKAKNNKKNRNENETLKDFKAKIINYNLKI